MRNVARAIDEIRAIMRDAGYTATSGSSCRATRRCSCAASENRYAEIDVAQRAGVGGCPSYDTDANWARDSVVSQIANGLKFVAVSKGVQFLDLRDAFQGREICSKSTRQASLSQPPSPTTSEWGRLLNESTVAQGVLQEAVHPNAYGQRALGRCLTLIYASFSRGGKCTNVAGQGPDAMRLTPFSSSAVSPRARAGCRRSTGTTAGAAARRRAAAIAARCSGRRVADVGLEVPLGVPRGDLAHVAVAADLGEHRGRGDRGAAAVAVDHGALLEAEVGDVEAVDEADAARRGPRPAAPCAAPRGWCCAARARRCRCTQRDTITERAAARSTSGYSSSRVSAVCCLESFSRLSARRSDSVSRSRSNSTAAATSGPASEPRPASSAPAT